MCNRIRVTRSGLPWIPAALPVFFRPREGWEGFVRPARWNGSGKQKVESGATGAKRSPGQPDGEERSRHAPIIFYHGFQEKYPVKGFVLTAREQAFIACLFWIIRVILSESDKITRITIYSDPTDAIQVFESPVRVGDAGLVWLVRPFLGVPAPCCS